MQCENCGEDFDRFGAENAMGYGDVRCPHCGHVHYAESREDFEARIHGTKKDDDERQGTQEA